MDRNIPSCGACRRGRLGCPEGTARACTAAGGHALFEPAIAEAGRVAMVPPPPGSTGAPVYTSTPTPPAPRGRLDPDVVAARFIALWDRLVAFRGDEALVALRSFEDTVGRLEVGRERHGDLRLDGGQDWIAEAREEALDGGVYIAAAAELAAMRGTRGGA